MKFLKNFLSKKSIFILLIILIFPAVILKYFVFSSKQSSESAVVKKGELVKELTLSGKIDADEHAILQFQTGGLVSYVGVKEGDTVKKYQTLASLDERTAQKNLQDKLIDYSTQRLTFDQTKEDYLNRIPEQALNDSMKRILQNNQYDLDKSVVSVELKALAKELSFLTTPIPGIVTRADLTFPGINIYTPSQGQFEVVNPDTVFFNVTADQTEVVNIKENMNGKIILDSYPDEKINSYIKSISFTPKSGESETVYEVKIEMDNINNANYKYKMGMTGDITFVTEKKQNVLFLPVNFVKSDNIGKYVFIDNKKTKTYVKTGLETDNDIEITKGIVEGSLIYD